MRLLLNYYYHFHSFQTLHEIMAVRFQGIFHNIRNYGSDFLSICGINALKSTKIHGNMGANFPIKMTRPPKGGATGWTGVSTQLSSGQYLFLSKNDMKIARYAF